jgi:hypothetical protein
MFDGNASAWRMVVAAVEGLTFSVTFLRKSWPILWGEILWHLPQRLQMNLVSILGSFRVIAGIKEVLQDPL